jgi:hypothetical protein
MRQAKVLWSAQNSNGLVIDGSLDPIVEGNIPPFATIETNLFKAVGGVEDVKAVRLLIEWPDGSGHVRYYEKRGDVWLKVSSDNIMPNWFVKAFSVGFVVLIIALVVAMIYAFTHGK